MKVVAAFVLAAMVVFAAAVPPSPQRQSAAFGPFGSQDPCMGGARPGGSCMGRGGAPGGTYGNYRFAPPPRRAKRQIGSSSAAAAAASGVGVGYGGMMGYGYPMMPMGYGFPMMG